MRVKPKVWRKITLVFAVLGLALLYAGSRIQVVEKGYEVSQLRGAVAKMRRTNGLLHSQVAKARTTSKLEGWTKRLGFSSPARSQVIFVEER